MLVYSLLEIMTTSSLPLGFHINWGIPTVPAVCIKPAGIEFASAAGIKGVAKECNGFNAAARAGKWKDSPHAAVLVTNLYPYRGCNIEVPLFVKCKVPVWGMVVVVCVVQPVELLS